MSEESGDVKDVRVELWRESGGSFDPIPVSELIDRLQDFVDQTPGEFRGSLTFEGSGYWYSEDDVPEFTISYWRPETSQEAEERKAKEREERRYWKERERGRDFDTIAALLRKYGLKLADPSA